MKRMKMKEGAASRNDETTRRTVFYRELRAHCFDCAIK